MVFSSSRFAAISSFWRQGLVAFVAAIVLAAQAPATAQLAGGGIPGPGYQLGLNALANGQYSDAYNFFRRELGGARREGNARWIDSICYYAMIGECEYRLGNLPQALNNFEAALNLYKQYPDWMIPVQFPPAVQAASNVAIAPWGKSNRGSRPGVYSDSLNLQVGNLAAAANAVRTGGKLVAPKIYSVSPYDVVRSVCLAMKRRRDILGPLIAHDPLTEELMGITARRLGPPNHWSEAWIDLQQGIAYNIGGRTQQADSFLKRSLMAMGQYDHPLTGLALLELGNIAMQSGDFKTAGGYFEEATYSAMQYNDNIVLEEAFRRSHLAYLLIGDPAGTNNALAAAIKWAKPRRELFASLVLLSAETMIVTNQAQQATALLNEARLVIGRSDMFKTEIGGRLNYLTAINSYQRGAMPAGDEALKLAMAWMSKGGSKWLFQIDYGDKLCVTNPNGRFGARTALQLYDQLLRDPGQFDWNTRPMESLAVLTTPHPLPYEHWLETAVQTDPDLALDVADLARRHRFFSTLQLGGRTMAMRWVLEAPDESLTNAARLQRQELLTRYPKFAEASNKAKQLRSQISAKSLSADADATTQRDAAKKLTELAAATTTQEAMLREMALRREAADMVFPPIRRTKELQKTLAPGQALLAFFATSRNTYAWLYSADKYEHWRVENPGQLKTRTIALLRAIGNFDGNRDLTEQQLSDASWKDAARDLLAAILGPKIKLNEQLKELVVVPDDVLWYVPFELLPVGSDSRPLITSARVRYAPTVGLSQPERQGRKPTPDYGVALGKLHLGQSEENSPDAMAEMQRVAPGAIALRGGWTTPSPLLGSSLDGLIVLDDIPAGKELYDWSPLPLDRAKNVGSLSAWLSLPWKQVDQYILPGFHTPAENALKTTPTIPGADLFLSTTALMSTGARTVLISRWRTGGQSAIDLIREFVQELPSVPADEAWQRAVLLLLETPIDAQREPRVKRSNNSELKAEHPFFWAGYMLVDTGAMPQQPADDAKPAMQAAGIKPPDAGQK